MNYRSNTLIICTFLLACLSLWVILNFVVQVNDEARPDDMREVEKVFNTQQVTELNANDFENVKEINFRYYTVKDGEYLQLLFKDYPVLDLAFSPQKNLIAFTYNSSSNGWVIELRVMSLENSNDISLVNEHFVFDTRTPIGNLSWFTSKYIHMMRACGTGCTELILVDTKSGEIKNGTVVRGYLTQKNGSTNSYFIDWFGEEHPVNYFIGEIRTETKGNLAYLVLEKLDVNLNIIGEDWWLLDDYKLILSEQMDYSQPVLKALADEIAPKALSGICSIKERLLLY